MTIELIAYPVLAFLAVTLGAKLIERRNDVLYGPSFRAARAYRQICATDSKRPWPRSACAGTLGVLP
jgi:hypothetical protein